MIDNETSNFGHRTTSKKSVNPHHRASYNMPQNEESKTNSATKKTNGLIKVQNNKLKYLIFIKQQLNYRLPTKDRMWRG